MEDLIKSIKALVKQHQDIGAEEIESLTSQFRERGISVMALEEILNFYTSYKKCDSEIHDEAFVAPRDVETTSNDILRQKLESEMQKNSNIIKRLEEEEKQVKKLKNSNRLLVSISLALTIIIILILCYK